MHTIIIGNGFDINLGLPTRYSDFIKSAYFHELIERKDSKLAKYLSHRSEHENWVDIENELKKYIKTQHTYFDFKREYEELCNALKNYMSSIDISKINRDSRAFQLFNNWIEDPDFTIIDFNYTSTSQNLLVERGIEEAEISGKLVKIHGSITHDYIIFGIEDELTLVQYSFLWKSAHLEFGKIDLSTKLHNSNKITIFGHSLGTTDHSYFKRFFSESSHSPGILGRKIIDIHFKSDHQPITQEVIKLTQGNLEGIRTKHQTKFIPV